MRFRFLSAVFALLFVTSIFGPILSVSAQDATPIVDSTAVPTEAAPEPDPSTPAPVEIKEPENASTPESDTASRQVQGDVEATGLDLSKVGFGPPYPYSYIAGDLFLPVEVSEDVSIKSGDTIVISYSTFSFLATGASFGPFIGEPFPLVSAELNSEMGTITITFNEDFETGGTTWAGLLTVQGEPIFNTLCDPQSDPQVVDVSFHINGGGQSTRVTIESEEPCGSDEDNLRPYVSDLEFSPAANSLFTNVTIPDSNSAKDATVTVTWPADKLSVAPGSHEAVVIHNGGEGSPRLPVSVVAVVEAGQMTITFENLPPDLTDIQALLAVDAVLTTDTCDPDGGLYTEDPGLLWVYADPAIQNGAFPIPVATVLCNGTGPSLRGEVSADGTRITWTFSSGDVLGDSYLVIDPSTPNQRVDCGTLTLVTDSQSGDGICFDESSGGPQEVGYLLFGEPATSGTMSIEFEILDPSKPQVFMACGSAASANGMSLMFETESTAGQGAEICAEVSSAGAEDAIAASFDREVVNSGDTVTLTIVANSFSAYWDTAAIESIDLGQYEVLDVDCAYAPEEVIVGIPCTIDESGNLTTTFWQNPSSESFYGGMYTEISVVITARLMGEPGGSYPVTACFNRSLLAHGGRIMIDSIGGETCSTAQLSIAPENPPATPSPTPTVAPTETPAPTPTNAHEQKETRVRVETSDGSSLEGANWSLFAPIASQRGEGAYLTGTLDAANTALLLDVPAGEYRFVVAPAGVDAQEFLITITDESQEILVQFAVAGTPVPTDPATPGATPTATADPTATSTTGVTGLPDTGNGSGTSSGIIMIAAIAASMLALAGFGLRARTEQ